MMMAAMAVILVLLTGCSTSNKATGSNASSAKTTNAKTTKSSNSYFEEIPVDNPIYLGFILLDEPTIEGMSEICEYHGLTPIDSSATSKSSANAGSNTAGKLAESQAITDGYTAYRATDGTILRFKQSEDPTAGVNGNLIEIRTKAPQKTIDKIFKILYYNKTESKNGQIIYDNGSHQSRTLLRATQTGTNPRIITFRSTDNPL